MATTVAVSLLLIALSVAFLGFDSSELLCLGIGIVCALLLVVRAVARRGKPRVMALLTLAAWSLFTMLLLTHYLPVRDHVRWFFLSRSFKARVLAQPVSTKGNLQHVEWDGWGFAGIADTTVFVVFDPDGLLKGAAGAPSPVRASGLPCDVVSVRRLEDHWYAVLFYTETYWGWKKCS